MSLSDDHKDNRWSLLSADIKELEALILDTPNMCWAKQIEKRLAYLEEVCEQCILEHQGREK